MIIKAYRQELRDFINNNDEGSDSVFDDDEDNNMDCDDDDVKSTKNNFSSNLRVVKKAACALASLSTTNKRNKNKKAEAKNKTRILKPSKPELKEPGDSSYPLNLFSLTITKTSGDVSISCLDAIDSFITNHCTRGGVSTEVGHRAFNLHLQAVMELRYGTNKSYITELNKTIRKLLPAKGKGHKLLLKLCAKAQTFNGMVGYITKDQGLAHYQIRVHNITAQDLTNGRREHETLLTSYDDAKKVIHTRNLFNECYRFNMRCMYPAIVPIQYALLYMLQSGSYILTPDFISNYKKIDLSEAEILWNIVHDPSSATIDAVMKLIFDPRSYGNKVGLFFYICI
jgi:hypothetical protein